MSTFSSLLEGAELSPPELFQRAWAIWGANMRAFTADPVRAKDELGAAAMLFRFLVISEQHLTSKQIAQCNTVIAMLDSLAALSEPRAKDVPATSKLVNSTKQQQPTSKVYAGMRSAPDAGALPSPSMLFGRSTQQPTPFPAASLDIKSAPDIQPDATVRATLLPEAHTQHSRHSHVKASDAGTSGAAADSQTVPAPHVDRPNQACTEPPATVMTSVAPECPAPPQCTVTSVSDSTTIDTITSDDQRAPTIDYAAMLATVPEGQQKQALGQWLYPRVVEHPEASDPAKITGMMLEMDAEDLVKLLDEPSTLTATISQACKALALFQAGAAPEHAIAPQPAKCCAGSPSCGTQLDSASPKMAIDPSASSIYANTGVNSKTPHPNAKTRLCKIWVQRGYCAKGSQCDFAHGEFYTTKSAATPSHESLYFHA